MNDAAILAIFRSALRGLRLKAGKTDQVQGSDKERFGQSRFERWRDRYKYRLRNATSLETARAALCALLSEGGARLDGVVEEIVREEKQPTTQAIIFWRDLHADWQRVRDLALIALSGGEEARHA